MPAAPTELPAASSPPSRPSDGPVRPRPLPRAGGGRFFIGHAPEAIEDPLGLYERAWREQGDAVEFRALGGIFRWAVLVHPDAVAHVLGTHHERYPKPPFFVKAVGPLFGRGLFLSDGGRWRRQRRLAAPAFSRDRLEGLIPTMAAAIEAELDRFPAGDGAVDVQERINRVALRLAARAFFGVDLEADAESFAGALADSFAFLRYRLDSPMPAPLFLPTSRNRAFRRSKATLERIIGSVIARRRAGEVPEGGDLLGMLLAASDEDTSVYTPAELIDEVAGFLIAGHDTTAAALTWTLELLSRHPDVLAELEEEVDAVLGERPATAADVPRLGLARRCFDEALRLYPPAWGQPRQAAVDDVIGGHLIPKGTIVTLAQWVTHRHPDFWDEPDRFDPSRFEPAAVAARHRFAYFPFGGGPRVCIGRQLALVEGTLALALMVRRFHLERPDGTPPAIPDPTFTLKPKGAVPLILVPRGRP